MVYKINILNYTYPKFKTKKYWKISIKRIKKSEMQRIINGYTLDGEDFENDEKIINRSNIRY